MPETPPSTMSGPASETASSRSLETVPTDLDCYVDHRSGSLRGFDNGVTDRCRIVFHQRSSGNIHVEIENLGNVANRYRLEVDARAPRFSGR